MASRRLAGFSRAFSVPGSLGMIVCLFLPMTRDCHGHVHTATGDGWAPIMLLVALLGVMPLLWASRQVRQVAPALTTLLAVVALGQMVIGIPIAIYLALRLARGRPEDREALTAIASAACIGVFLALFPLLSTLIDGEWLIGGYLAWFAAWVELVGLVLWWRVAATRVHRPPPLAVDEIFG